MYFLFKLQITWELQQNTCEPCNASTTKECMCVVKKQFDHIEFVFNSFYVDLKCSKIYVPFTVEFLCLCAVWSCGCSWAVGEVVLVVCVVCVVTAMRVLLFVWEVSMLRECEGDGNDGVGVGEVSLR